MLVQISLTSLIKKIIKSSRQLVYYIYIFGKVANFSSHNSLLHKANKLFFEVTELISNKHNSDFALCIIFTIEFFAL